MQDFDTMSDTIDNFKKLKIAILGTGNIGTDLLMKILRSPYLECTCCAGRNLDSRGMVHARNHGVTTSDRGIKAILEAPDCCDLVFDATSAISHQEHWPQLERLGKFVIDLTPSRIGEMVIPAISLGNLGHYRNVNMVSCGGQASIPLAHLISLTHECVNYIEVVSSIASKSAGPATRENIDEYIETTEEGIRKYSGAKSAKAILILNPAEPSVDMQTTISAKVGQPNLEGLRRVFDDMVRKIQSYVPGYCVMVPPIFETNRIVIMVKVVGRGDYLPTFAGNLDIINCAAIATAEEFSKEQARSPEVFKKRAECARL